MIGGALSRETQLFMSTVLAPIIQGRSTNASIADDRLWPHRDMWDDFNLYDRIRKAWNSWRTRSLDRV